ncbi:MAG: hypothetical protein ABFS28_08620 [Bacteroidota bacterium]
MNRIITHSFLLLSLFSIYGMAQEAPVNDSIPVVELMIKDTLELELHGPSSDITFYTNGMVFLSNSKYHQNMIPDHITFGVIKAYFVPLEYIALESSTPLFVNDNFPYSPAGMSFTRNYQKVYFTKAEDHHGRRNVEKIYEMEIIDGRASGHEQLSFTTDPSRYLHPAISMDESFMIFSSDRTPSSGGLDLYITRKTSGGWSKPENMGHSINSSSHEWYPYLDHNNDLYFSSAGHMGYGGYDIYVCKYNGSSWDPPRNLTTYINSEQDELGLSIHPNKHMAVFTQVADGAARAEVFKISLSEKASLIADNSDGNDISVLLSDLIESGYTEGNLPSSDEMLAGKDRLITSTPLIFEEAEQPAKPEAEVQDASSLMEAAAARPETAQPETPSEPDPNRLLFRVQILSSTSSNTSPRVTIEGKTYLTFEYYYKGAYRITVGEFEELSDATAFRGKCRNSGFDQAWVAAFRGKERETDPSVFRK